MKPTQAISMLNRQIAAHGQPIGFKRKASGALGKVMAVEPIHIGSTVVRYNITARMM